MKTNIEIAADYQHIRMKTMYKLQLALLRSKQRTLNRRQSLRYIAFKKNSLDLQRHADRMSRINLMLKRLHTRYSSNGQDLLNTIKSLGWEGLKDGE